MPRLSFAHSLRLLGTLLVLLSAAPLLRGQETASRMRWVFLGDFMQHSPQVEAARGADGSYDYRPALAALRPLFQDAHFCVVNMETCFGPGPYKGYPCFNSPPEAARAVRDAGANIFLCANNHILDQGSRGLAATLDLYDSLGVRHCGAYRDSLHRARTYPLILEQGNMKVALLNYTYGTNGHRPSPPFIVNYLDSTLIRTDVARARALGAGLLIACVHWGAEYRLHPDASQLRWEAWLRAQGVDVIIGSHPHVPQGFDLEEDEKGEPCGFTAWSLGNLISNMTAPNTRIGLAVGFTLEPPCIPEIRPRLRRPWYCWHWTWRRPGAGAEAYRVLPLSPQPWPPDFEADVPQAAKAREHLRRLRPLLTEEARLRERTLGPHPPLDLPLLPAMFPAPIFPLSDTKNVSPLRGQTGGAYSVPRFGTPVRRNARN